MTLEEIYKRYAILEQKRRDIEKEQSELKQRLSEDMPEEGTKFYYGSYSWQNRKKWSYSDKVTEMEAELKSLKKLEEKEGTATFEESKSVVYRHNKPVREEYPF